MFVCPIEGEKGSTVRAYIPVATLLGNGSTGWVGAIFTKWVGPHVTSGARWGPVGGATWADPY